MNIPTATLRPIIQELIAQRPDPAAELTDTDAEMLRQACEQRTGMRIPTASIMRALASIGRFTTPSTPSSTPRSAMPIDRNPNHSRQERIAQTLLGILAQRPDPEATPTHDEIEPLRLACMDRTGEQIGATAIIRALDTLGHRIPPKPRAQHPHHLKLTRITQVLRGLLAQRPDPAAAPTYDEIAPLRQACARRTGYRVGARAIAKALDTLGHSLPAKPRGPNPKQRRQERITQALREVLAQRPDPGAAPSHDEIAPLRLACARRIGYRVGARSFAKAIDAIGHRLPDKPHEQHPHHFKLTQVTRALRELLAQRPDPAAAPTHDEIELLCLTCAERTGYKVGPRTIANALHALGHSLPPKPRKPDPNQIRRERIVQALRELLAQRQDPAAAPTHDEIEPLRLACAERTGYKVGPRTIANALHALGHSLPPKPRKPDPREIRRERIVQALRELLAQRQDPDAAPSHDEIEPLCLACEQHTGYKVGTRALANALHALGHNLPSKPRKPDPMQLWLEQIVQALRELLAQRPSPDAELTHDDAEALRQACEQRTGQRIPTVSFTRALASIGHFTTAPAIAKPHANDLNQVRRARIAQALRELLAQRQDPAAAPTHDEIAPLRQACSKRTGYNVGTHSITLALNALGHCRPSKPRGLHPSQVRQERIARTVRELLARRKDPAAAPTHDEIAPLCLACEKRTGYKIGIVAIASALRALGHTLPVRPRGLPPSQIRRERITQALRELIARRPDPCAELTHDDVEPLRQACMERIGDRVSSRTIADTLRTLGHGIHARPRAHHPSQVRQQRIVLAVRECLARRPDPAAELTHDDAMALSQACTEHVGFKVDIGAIANALHAIGLSLPPKPNGPPQMQRRQERIVQAVRECLARRPDPAAELTNDDAMALSQACTEHIGFKVGVGAIANALQAIGCGLPTKPHGPTQMQRRQERITQALRELLAQRQAPDAELTDDDAEALRQACEQRTGQKVTISAIIRTLASIGRFPIPSAPHPAPRKTKPRARH